MKKAVWTVCILTAVMLAAGCQQQAAESGGTYEVTVQNGNEWCQAGSSWASTGHGASSNMVIKGIVSSGKYAGHCHVKYDVSTGEGNANIDYYFKEDGSGYQVMDINGQHMETEWSGE
jgi:hypothetical protein